MISDCCGAMVVMGDMCSRCGEHCGVMNSEFSDDAYDAAVQAYWDGYGPPVTRRQREEEQDEIDEYRRNNRY